MSAFILSLKGRDKTKALRKFFELLDVVRDREGLRIADTEKQILSYFFLLEDTTPKYRFSASSKKLVVQAAEKDAWKLTSQNLNNKLNSLVSKDLLIRDENGEFTAKGWLESVIGKMLYAIDTNTEYDIKFRFGNDTTQSN